MKECTGAACVPAGTGACFVAGTLVLTRDGLRPIETVQVGELLYSRDEVTMASGWKPVRERVVTHDRQVMRLQLKGDDGTDEDFTVTPTHPFWVDQHGWVEAGELVPGQLIARASGGWLRVQRATWLQDGATVWHSYFVGEAAAWVHNGGPECPEVPPLPRVEYSLDKAPTPPQPGVRQTGIDRAWRQEVQLIEETGRGSRPWTAEEIKRIRSGEGYRDLGYTGHHRNRVADEPDWQGDPRNIEFYRQGAGEEHMAKGHPGGTRAPQPPQALVGREAMLEAARQAVKAPKKGSSK